MEIDWNLFSITIFYIIGVVFIEKTTLPALIQTSKLRTNPYLFTMQNRPIHENLDTSFVNLSALVKYLRRRQFVGLVKIRLNGYEAEIFLDQANELNVSEHDLLSGRVAEGEEALQRILIRAREPGGTINVFQQAEISAENPAQETDKKFDVASKITPAQIISPQVTEENFVGVAIPKPTDLPENGHRNPVINQTKNSQPIAVRQAEKVSPVAIADSVLPANAKVSGIDLHADGIAHGQKSSASGQSVSLPDFPFRLSNKVEERAKKVQEISTKEWQTLLNLTVEILGTIDKKLAQANLDFTSAFKTACAEITDDYPFLSSTEGTFAYSKGRMKMTKRVNPKIFTASIFEAIRRILEKLESNPKFIEIHRTTVQTLLALMNKRRRFYDKFEMSSQLGNILGV